MATILLAAAGAAVGSGFGGTVLGLSGAVIGRAVGATVGRSIDQRILGSGSDAVEVGKIDRFHLSGVGYGTPIQDVWGRMRVAGQVIWASQFAETRRTSGGGKGTPRPVTTSFSYSVSLAIALCRGEALCVGRIWADGVEIPLTSIDFQFYAGSEDQLPDPKIEAVEGAGMAPSYRGICYVVIESLALEQFGNRVPQFSFEVIRRAAGSVAEDQFDLPRSINAVALIPGSGEYSLATTPTYFNLGPGLNQSADVHTVQETTDFQTSLRQLQEELPNCTSVSLVVSWFGSDLRCDSCTIQPKVEQNQVDPVGMPWVVSGVTRSDAAVVPSLDGRPVYGGTPSDKSVIEAINAIRQAGKEVMFYPFILMDQEVGNILPDPWSDAPSQPALPWRGRITLPRAPGLLGSADETSAAGDQVAAFLGAAAPAEFSNSRDTVMFTDPSHWGYRRFILHYAHLCALAGGVDAFCIGSELRGMTQIRASENTFPMVDALRTLASEVKEILGSGTKISYAADWSEYFGLHSGGDVFFNLDSLWSDTNIDFVGIDNYMPISDWRDEPNNLDQSWGSIYNPEYLLANIAGGEGYDWYYDSEEAAANQTRLPIRDLEFGEDWVFRFKDIAGWWSQDHHERVGGVRDPLATAWVPGMKPIRFTEYGCAALNKATNQPNKFVDLKSSESSLPRGSDGRRDDFIQMQYFHAMAKYWEDRDRNPNATLYNGRMVDFERCHAWAWDARPFPDFPGNTLLWNDGGNYQRGHWLNGRSSNQPLPSVIAEICAASGLDVDIDVTNLFGDLRGFVGDDSQTARSKLQALALAYGFDVGESNGTLRFFMRGGNIARNLDFGDLAIKTGTGTDVEKSRAPDLDSINRVRLAFVEAENNYDVISTEAIFPDDSPQNSAASELPIQLSEVEASAVVERWLSEARLSTDTISLSLPKSELGLRVGDSVSFQGVQYLLNQIEDSNELSVDGVRVQPDAYQPGSETASAPNRLTAIAQTPVFVAFMDLPLLTGDENPIEPHIAVASTPWPGPMAVWSSAADSGYSLNVQVVAPAILGRTETVLESAPSCLWDHGSVLRVRLTSGTISAMSALDVLNGANVAVVGDGSPENWEIIQFSQVNIVGPDTYELSMLLRGLAGSDATVPASWPVGSYFVVIDSLIPQVNLSAAARGLVRYYRIGDARKGYSDQNVVVLPVAFNGIGLRPYSVSHLVSNKGTDGSLAVSWIRRTRIDGDSWQSIDVPLGEDAELYEVRVFQGSTIVRQTQVAVPYWTYTSEMQALDGVVAPLLISVAQVSQSFGDGPFESLSIT